MLALYCCSLIAAGCKQQSAAPLPRQVGRAGAITIRGAGASFPLPLYSRWALQYLKHTGMGLLYRGVGSQAGIEAVKTGRVDFGASDIPLSRAAQRESGLVQFPLVIGGVAVIYNLPGIRAGELRLTPALLQAIYWGKLRRWNDPALAAVNPGITLPDRELIPIRRDRASGTGRLFAKYVDQPGAATLGDDEDEIEAKDSAQVVEFVTQFKYTLGYVELAYATEHKLDWARLKNRAGRFVAPGHASFEAAAEHGAWRVDHEVVLSGGPGPGSWPITGASYILVQANQPDSARATQMLRFFHWALTAGGAAADSAGYVAIPARHVQAIERRWATAIRAGSRPLWPSPTPTTAPAPATGPTPTTAPAATPGTE